MGNCAGSACRHAAPWATGDGELVSPPGHEEGSGEVRTGVEVTIRISKRRLQELLMAKAASGGEGVVMAETVLAEIVSACEVVNKLHRRRRWEPELQSIPEAVES